MAPDKKTNFIDHVRDNVDAFIRDLPSGQQVLIFTMLVLGLSGISYAAEQKQQENERMCPGKLNLAPQETAIFNNEGMNYQIRHRGISLGPDTVDYSVSDSSLNTIFGGNIKVPAGEDVSVGGVNFQGRGTRDQSMTGDVITFRSNDQNSCIAVVSPDVK